MPLAAMLRHLDGDRSHVYKADFGNFTGGGILPLTRFRHAGDGDYIKRPFRGGRKLVSARTADGGDTLLFISWESFSSLGVRRELWRPGCLSVP